MVDSLADAVPDNPAWAGAICPNCHREIHHAVLGSALRLQDRIRGIEEEAKKRRSAGSALA